MDKAYIYVETAFHHEGDMQYIKNLILSAKESGVHGVKFQVLTEVSDFISTKHTSYATLKEYCFDISQWNEIFEFTVLNDLEIIMMPLNIGAFQLLNNHKVSYLEIHSVSFYDDRLLEKVKESGVEIILGTGGRTLQEIDDKIKYFDSKISVLMVGFQSFPSKLEHVKIGKIKHLVNRYPKLAIGYADHSAYDDPFSTLSNDYARLLGATFFEKHITLEHGVERVDYNSATDSKHIKEMVRRIQYIETHILTNYNDSFQLHSTEETYRDRQLICVASTDLLKGTVLKKHQIVLKMMDAHPDNMFRIQLLLGKELKSSIKKDMPIQSTNLIYDE